MCYLKNLAVEEEFDFDAFQIKAEESSKDEASEENVLVLCQEKHQSPCWNFDQQRLVNLFELVEKNNEMISQISKALGKNSQQHENISIQNQQSSSQFFFEKKTESLPVKSAQSSWPASHPLVEKVFGSNSYSYRLEAVQKFPEIIFKERNFNLSIRLVNKQGELVKNSNLINLCVSFCTNEGQWIHQNRVGETFMKGKTDSELIKGESEFVKLYPRDVSRFYPQGKVTLMVYCKPSTLLYAESSQKNFVECCEIEPLLIENITIKAKKTKDN